MVLEESPRPLDAAMKDTRIKQSTSSLPVELVRYIMEIVAEDYDGMAPTLMHVSKDVYVWIMPIFYNTISLRNQSSIALLSRTLRYRGPQMQGNIGEHVRRLFIRGWSNMEATAVIVRACSRLEYLVTNAVLSHPAFLDDHNSRWPVPWHVMLIVGSSRQLPPMGHPLLRNVKYLYIECMDFKVIEKIRRLEHLTHLAVGFWGVNNETDFPLSIGHILRSVQSLAMLLLVAYTYDESERQSTNLVIGGNWVELRNIQDERLFARPGLSDEEYGTIMKSKVTIWDNAEIKYRDWRTVSKPFAH